MKPLHVILWAIVCAGTSTLAADNAGRTPDAAEQEFARKLAGLGYADLARRRLEESSVSVLAKARFCKEAADRMPADQFAERVGLYRDSLAYYEKTAAAPADRDPEVARVTLALGVLLWSAADSAAFARPKEVEPERVRGWAREAAACFAQCRPALEREAAALRAERERFEAANPDDSVAWPARVREQHEALDTQVKAAEQRLVQAGCLELLCHPADSPQSARLAPAVESLCRETIDAHEGHTAVFWDAYWFARVLAHLGHADECRALCEDALKLNPPRSELLPVLGAAKTDSLLKEIAVWRIRIYGQAARCLTQLRQYPDAERIGKRLWADYPKCLDDPAGQEAALWRARALIAWGDALRAEGREHRALQCFDSALEIAAEVARRERAK